MSPAGIAKLFNHTDLATGWCMKIPSAMPRLKGYRHPREIIAYAVWAYHRFALSTADVEDLLAERGVIISRETIRLWVDRFGAHFAACIRRDRPRPNDNIYPKLTLSSNYWMLISLPKSRPGRSETGREIHIPRWEGHLRLACNVASRDQP